MPTPTHLAARLDADLKAGMRARNKAQVDCLRQVRAKIQAEVNQQPTTPLGPPPDALVEKVIATYVKSLRKAIDEMAAAGERSAQLRAQYAQECTLLQAYLPTPLSAQALSAAAQQVAEELQLRAASDQGRLLGELMRRHPKVVDVALARPIIAKLLA